VCSSLSCRWTSASVVRIYFVGETSVVGARTIRLCGERRWYASNALVTHTREVRRGFDERFRSSRTRRDGGGTHSASVLQGTERQFFVLVGSNKKHVEGKACMERRKRSGRTCFVSYESRFEHSASGGGVFARRLSRRR